ncbi:MAG TPA: proton-conducting transporter membrane subunit [Thermoanaerobaculia bacterium]
MTPLAALGVALLLHLAGGALPAFGRGKRAEQAAAALSVCGSLFGLAAAAGALLAAQPGLLAAPWHVPGGAILLRLDALAAAFLLVIFLVSGLGSVYGLDYWPRAERPRSAARLRGFYALMTIGLALVVTAANMVLFLLAWEVMAVSAFFLVATEDARAEVRRAAWVYLVATHAGTACLFAAFALLKAGTGSFEIQKVAPFPGMSVVFLLAVFGFGMKAGIVPLHFWLPAAHASAPSHVSALMSGVMLKAGVYGILRVSSLVDAPPLWWGLLLAGLGAVSAVTGIAMAAGQTDLKRALAYSSVENMGIVWLGIGLAVSGRALEQPAWVTLGFCGSLFHVFSHACFKSLLFFGAGGILHATRTRSMELLGGLARRMPATAGLALVGALAAAGLPLFNGFVGEWLIALGLFDTLRSSSSGGWLLAFGAPALALAGALALASFVRIAGVTFLGAPRSLEAAEAHEAPALMTAPMAILAVACLGLGLWPSVLLPVLGAAEGAWLGAPVGTAFLAATLARPAWALVALAAALALAGAWLAMLSPRGARRVPTWDCGYAAPNARMQYTSGSFGAAITAVLPAFLAPASAVRSPEGAFPAAASFRTEAPDPFGARLYEPFAARWGGRLAQLRKLQSGRLTLYLVYVFLTMLVTLAWSVLRPYVR